MNAWAPHPSLAFFIGGLESPTIPRGHPFSSTKSFDVYSFHFLFYFFIRTLLFLFLLPRGINLFYDIKPRKNLGESRMERLGIVT